eukprot:symbB.v1.2.021000.t1/scaffold1794.1/size101098/7
MPFFQRCQRIMPAAGRSLMTNPTMSLPQEPKLEGHYQLSFDLPVAVVLREQILLSMAREAQEAILEIKELLQLLLQEKLGSLGFLPWQEASETVFFTIHATGQYSGNANEALRSLQNSNGSRSGYRPSKKRRREEPPPAALTGSAVMKALNDLNNEDLKAKLGLEDLSEGLQRVNGSSWLQLQIRREGFFIRGRYLKLSRRLPQSPWVIEGERKGDGSVEEDIATPVAQHFGAEVRFHAEGREDIDVRMLGLGRPFVLEVRNARHLSVELAEVQRAVNAAGDRVQISHLRECQVGRGIFLTSACHFPRVSSFRIKRYLS